MSKAKKYLRVKRKETASNQGMSSLPKEETAITDIIGIEGLTI